MLKWLLALSVFVCGIWLLATSFTHSYKQCQAGRAPEFSQPYKPVGHEKVQTFLLCQGESLEANGELITAFGTLFIAFFTWTLWQATERAGEHFRVTERAYVKLSHHPPGIDWINSTWGRVRLRVRNFGRTPSEVSDALLIHKVVPAQGGALPDDPPYGPGAPDRLPEQFFLVKDDEFTFINDFVLTAAERAAINSGDSLLIMFGYVDYRDKFGERHRGGYARMYDPAVDVTGPLTSWETHSRRNNLPNFPHRFYNYDRPRKPGEGNDWPD